MKLTLAGLVTLGLIAGASLRASADDSYWPGEPNGYAQNTAAKAIKPNPCPPASDPIQPLGCGVVPQTGWNPWGTVALTADELKAQQEANRAYHRQLRARTLEEGGCNAPVLAVWMAAQCNRETNLGGSTGGSD
jgi:hypothetical protein